MARKAVISEKVLKVMQQMARELPDDVTTVREQDVMRHPALLELYNESQLASALILLERHERILTVGKGLFKVVIPKRPLEGLCDIPSHIASALGLSGEGVFYLQMTRLTCARI
jgi:hypothetical protein